MPQESKESSDPHSEAELESALHTEQGAVEPAQESSDAPFKDMPQRELRAKLREIIEKGVDSDGAA